MWDERNVMIGMGGEGMGRVSVSCKSERMQCYGFVWGGSKQRS